VVKGTEIDWERSRHGQLGWYLNSQEDATDVSARSALQDWDVFIHEITTAGGMHRHQGGLVIYVIEGKGHTIVNERRVDWKSGDLLLLPVLPGGVAHQHFNDQEGKPARWLAFIYRPMHNALGSYVEQISTSPDSPD
jgi:uncharacterized RmlC-like cupin family protein